MSETMMNETEAKRSMWLGESITTNQKWNKRHISAKNKKEQEIGFRLESLNSNEIADLSSYETKE